MVSKTLPQERNVLVWKKNTPVWFEKPWTSKQLLLIIELELEKKQNYSVFLDCPGPASRNLRWKSPSNTTYFFLTHITHVPVSMESHICRQSEARAKPSTYYNHHQRLLVSKTLPQERHVLVCKKIHLYGLKNRALQHTALTLPLSLDYHSWHSIDDPI